MKLPHYDLGVAQGQPVLIPRRALPDVSNALQCDLGEAGRFIEKTFKLLKYPHNFKDAVLLPQRAGRPQQADEYGIQDSGVVWYVKFRVDAVTPATVICSFHEAEWPLKLANGRTLKSPR